VPLPLGVPHFFLSSAFGSSAFLMLSHTKAKPLDGLVHRLLGYCMAAVAVMVLAQGVVGRRSYGLNAAKSLALVMQVSKTGSVHSIGFKVWCLGSGAQATGLLHGCCCGDGAGSRGSGAAELQAARC
jgi:hypothetical protein